MDSFADLGMGRREREAQISLAACYWREGAYDDARVLLRVTLGALGVDEDDLRVRATLWLAAVEKMETRYDEALALYAEIEPLVGASGDSLRRGNFHNDRGQVLLHAGEARHDSSMLVRAVEDFGAAHEHYQQAGHLRYAGAVQNNLASLHNAVGNPAAAHVALDRAREIFASLCETSYMAMVDDTRARVFIDQKMATEAVESAARAVSGLEGGDEYGLLVDALTTYATALARARRFAASLSAFARAEQIADERVGGGAGRRVALAMIEEVPAILCAEAGLSFDDAVHRFEEGIIRHALSATGGRVTETALRIGLKYQTLAWMLNTRHSGLLDERTEIKKRRKSLIKRHGKVLKYEKKK
jgi:tetratricopeptide (TPR) repeat protein